MKQSWAAIGCAVCLLFGAAAAEDAPAAPPPATLPSVVPPAAPAPSAERMAAAREVMGAGLAAQFLDTAALTEAIVKHIKQTEPLLDDKTLGTIRQVLRESFDQNKQKLIEQLTVMYATHFSVDDLKAIAAFYKSAAGQHLIAETPEIALESSRLTVPIMMAAMQRLKETLAEQQSGADDNGTAAPDGAAGKDAPQAKSEPK